MSENHSRNTHKKVEHPFTATIPYNVLADKKLSDGAKIYFCTLSALSKENGYCYATNKQLAELLEKSEDTIKKYNTELRTRGHIILESNHIPYKKEGSTKILWSNRKKIYTYPAFIPKEGYVKIKEKSTKVVKYPPSHDGGKISTSKSIKESYKTTSKKQNSHKSEIYDGSPNKNKKEESLKEKKGMDSYPESLKLATMLREYIDEWGGRLSKSIKIKSWADDINKIIYIDGYSKEEIQDVLYWFSCKEPSKNGFTWRNQILSGKNLRKKFDLLFNAMKSES